MPRRDATPRCHAEAAGGRRPVGRVQVALAVAVNQGPDWKNFRVFVLLQRRRSGFSSGGLRWVAQSLFGFCGMRMTELY
jgi:hypothetical protein